MINDDETIKILEKSSEFNNLEELEELKSNLMKLKENSDDMNTSNIIELIKHNIQENNVMYNKLKIIKEQLNDHKQ